MLAKKAVEKGLKVKPWVKTSLAPGSKVVTDYFEKAGLMPYLEAAELPPGGLTAAPPASATAARCPKRCAEAVTEENLVVAAVLSGNRNFEGRINPQVKANYLASPPLVVAYALAGTRRYRYLDADPLGAGLRRHSRSICATSGPPIEEVRNTVRDSIGRDMFQHEYEQAFEGDANWQIDARALGRISSSGTMPPPTSRSRRISTTWSTRKRPCRI